MSLRFPRVYHYTTGLMSYVSVNPEEIVAKHIRLTAWSVFIGGLSPTPHGPNELISFLILSSFEFLVNQKNSDFNKYHDEILAC